MAVRRRRRGGDPSLDPPPQTKGTIAGKHGIYHRKNLIGRFLGTQTFGSQTPPPPKPRAGRKRKVTGW